MNQRFAEIFVSLVAKTTPPFGASIFFSLSCWVISSLLQAASSVTIMSNILTFINLFIFIPSNNPSLLYEPGLSLFEGVGGYYSSNMP